MTRTTNARIAGFTYLFYIAVGISSMILSGKAVSGEGTAAILASIAQHAPQFRVTVVLNLLASFSALVLGVTLYGITRDEDNELAVLAMVCVMMHGHQAGAQGLIARLALYLSGHDAVYTRAIYAGIA